MEYAALAPGLIVVLPLAAALVLLGVPDARRSCAWIAGVTMLAGCALVVVTAPHILAGEILRVRLEWLPQIGLAMGARMDGLAWMFTLLICAIGALIVLYAAYYLGPADPPRRFFATLLAFQGAMLGIVLADNLILLVIFWELTSVTSFLLVGYWHHRQDAREGARMALTVTGTGGLALLGGVLLLGHIAGSYDLDVVLGAGDTIRAHSMYMPALLLVLLGCFTKSAQFPFHFWLPHAMAAPTPVSAFLHSATMVKAGVFLLARLYPALGQSEPWFWIVSLIGATTLVLGAYIAIFKHDLKGLLAYSTISHLGLITLLFGLDEPLAVVAGVFHIINHAIFKASLFMAVGIIDHETGTRDMRRINGLWKYMPWTGALAMVAAGAMAGVPLANGFLSKEMFFAETLAKDGHLAMEIALPIIAVTAGIFSVAYSVRFIHDVFFNGEPVGLDRQPHEPPRFMRLPVEALVALCLAVGLAPAFVIGPILQVAASAALGAAPPAYTLALWHGLNWPLAMSALALTGGIALYFGLHRFINLHRIPVRASAGRAAFLAIVDRSVRGAYALTNALQSGSLQRYLALLVILAVAAAAWPFVRDGVRFAVPLGSALEGAGPATISVTLIGVAAAIATVAAYRHRLLALVLLGAVGLVVSLAFVYLSAPDLALTQLCIEVTTVLLMMLALRWLPAESPPEARSARGPRFAHVLIASVAGIGAALLVLEMLALGPTSVVSPYYLETARSEGGGANVVNVIIVDYRGFDTLGEITVLGIAGLMVFALLRAGLITNLPPARASDARAERSFLLQVVVPRLLPFAALVSIYLFLRGHNEPGGGFIAGLALAVALALLFVSHGLAWTESRLRIDFADWIGWGLLIAGLTGIGSWFVGSPFLTSSYAYPQWPLIGAVPLASASLFDLGVYLTVIGATMLALLAFARLRQGGGTR